MASKTTKFYKWSTIQAMLVSVAEVGMRDNSCTGLTKALAAAVGVENPSTRNGGPARMRLAVKHLITDMRRQAQLVAAQAGGGASRWRRKPVAMRQASTRASSQPSGWWTRSRLTCVICSS